MSLLSKFPSYDIVIKGAMATFKRYPLALISAILGTVAAVALADWNNQESEDALVRLLMVSALGVPFFVALVHFAEKQHLRKQIDVGLRLGGVILLLAYYFTLPEDVSSANIYPVRFLLLNIGLHFLVAVLPFIKGKDVEGFWQYNKSLFLRFLLAALYSGVLYIGLTIALAAADHLFGFDVKEVRYAQLWIIVVGIFNTWVFLGGIPDNLDNLNEGIEYPKGLKVFTQYILLPLVALYFVILIAYEGKIIIQWNWPKGWVSHLVLWYSVVGILSSLLLHPLRERAGNLWIQVFTKWFYRALVPLVILLFLAIMRRLSDYGVTENRYFVLAMAIGLSIVVVYFIVSKAKDIRIIPGILCVIALLAAYGPWSAFSVSKSCQQGRLQAMMETYNILTDGAVQKAPETIPFEQRKEMSSIISYLVDWHGLGSFSGWLSDSTLATVDTIPTHMQDTRIAKIMGFEWVSKYSSLSSGEYFTVDRDMAIPFEVGGYQYLIEMYLFHDGGLSKEFDVNNIPFTVDFKQEQFVLTIRAGEEEKEGNTVDIPMAEPLAEVASYSSMRPELLTFSAECSIFDALVVLEHLYGYGEGDSLEIRQLRADLLLRLK